MSDVELATQHLLDCNIRPSLQRVAIMHYLLVNKTHPTVDEIHHSLVQKMPTLSKTTVYNTLRILSDHGAVLWLNIEDREVRFDGDISHHLHFKCRKCGGIHDIRIAEFPVAEQLYVGNIGKYKVDDTQIIFKGLCPKCAAEMADE